MRKCLFPHILRSFDRRNDDDADGILCEGDGPIYNTLYLLQHVVYHCKINTIVCRDNPALDGIR